MHLDKIFENYDRKIETKNDQAKRQEDARFEAQNRCLKVIKESFLPVFEEISLQINANGHRAELLTGFEKTGLPRIELKFTPVVKAEKHPPHISPSKIEVQHLTRNTLRVKRVINTANGKVPTYTRGSSEISPSHKTATPDWVRKVTIEFIQAVLDAN